jgi:GT2 family glycosyltransferase
MAKTYIITPTFNNEDYTLRCFGSILKNTKDYNLIWIDNGSSAESREKVKKFLDENNVPYELIANKENLGFVKATNQGMKRAMGLGADYIVLQNNDTEVYEGWLERMIEVAQGDPKIGLVGPLVSPCESWQSISNLKKMHPEFADLPEYPGNPEEYAKIIKKKYKEKSVEADEYLAFFCALIKKEVVENIGYLSEDYGIGFGDDNDYCIRAIKAGWRLALAKDVFVFHNHRTTFKSLFSDDEIRDMQTKNTGIYNMKKIFASQFDPERCPYCGKKHGIKLVDECEKKSPLISVIIPSRVGEEIFSLKTLKSQTYKKIEIIVEYDQKKEGVSVVRNQGAEKAKGQFLFFCDNDLLLSQTCLSDLYLTLKSSPESKWAFGKFYVDDYLFNENKNLEIPKVGTVDWVNYFEGISTMSLIDASVNPRFDEEMKRFNDWNLWLTLHESWHNPVFCDKVLFVSNNKKGGISNSNIDDYIKWKNKLYRKHDVDVEAKILSLQNEKQGKEQELNVIKSSKTWKLLAIYSKLRSWFASLGKNLK